VAPLPINRRGVARNVRPGALPFDRSGYCAAHKRRDNNGANAKRHLSEIRHVSSKGDNHVQSRNCIKTSRVCTENLSSGVVVVKSAKDGVRFDASDSLNLASDRRIFIQ
jgi:hypothetical protein